MPGAALVATADTSRIEAPVTLKAYLMCAFAAFGGILFGYDSGYISSVMGMRYFITLFSKDQNATAISSSRKSLITSILSAGTFFGALAASDMADYCGRRTTVMIGCFIFAVGVSLQTASTYTNLLVGGRLVAGLGVGFVSAIIILYMSEIAPRKVRGSIVAGYQFSINVGILLASSIDYATQNLDSTASYRIPIGIQMLWALILGGGLFFLPESPRFFVRKGKLDEAAHVLSRVRGQPVESEYIQNELSEIVANYKYELEVVPQGSYLASWFNCFKGGLSNPASNLRRTILGTSLQMMQQFTGINFIFYFGTTFFQQLGTISNPFFISLITALVNVCATPVSFYTVERFGRRPIMLVGAIGMVICQLIVAITGTVDGSSNAAVSSMIAFICIYIFFFGCTWGPGPWILVGEVFNLPIRARGIGLSTASNWFWNCIIAVITPYLVDGDKANLGAKIFYLWGGLCITCVVYTYYLVPETKGLSLEQIDRMFEESTPRTSSKWVPHSTFSADMGFVKREGSVSEVEEVKNTEV